MYEILCLRAVQNPQVILFSVFHFNYEFYGILKCMLSGKTKYLENMTFLSVDFLESFLSVRIYEYIWISFELINEFK